MTKNIFLLIYYKGKTLLILFWKKKKIKIEVLSSCTKNAQPRIIYTYSSLISSSVHDYCTHRVQYRGGQLGIAYLSTRKKLKFAAPYRPHMVRNATAAETIRD